MKQKLHRLSFVLTTFVIVFSSALYILAGRDTVQAIGTSLYLTPRYVTINRGGTFTVSLYTNTNADRPVNAVKARLLVPSGLQFVSENPSGSAFNQNLLGNNNPSGTGYYNVSRSSNTGSRTGNLLVTRLTFRGVSNGSHSISFDKTNNRTYVINYPSTTNLANPIVGGTYTVNNPPTQPPPATDVCPNLAGTQTSVPSGYVRNSSGQCVRRTSGGGSGSGGGGSTSGGSRPSSIPTATIPKKESSASSSGLKISNFNISDFDYRTATVTWKTNQPATSKINYGTNYDDMSEEIKSSKKTTSHKIVIKGESLRAGNHYFARITSDDGKAPVTLDAEFDTRAILVGIKVNDASGNPVEGALVYAGEVEGTSDKNGEVTLEMAEGPTTIIANKDGMAGETTAEVIIPKDGDEVQQVIIDLTQTVDEAGTEASTGGGILGYIIGIIILFVLAGLAFFLWRRRQFAKYDSPLADDMYGVSAPPTSPPPASMHDHPPAPVNQDSTDGPQHFPSLSELVQKDLDSKKPKTAFSEEPKDMFSELDEPEKPKAKGAAHADPSPKEHTSMSEEHVSPKREPAHEKHEPEAVVNQKDHSLKINH